MNKDEDAIALLSVVPFVYFSSRVIKSIPLTLAVLNNALGTCQLRQLPIFIGSINLLLDYWTEFSSPS